MAAMPHVALAVVDIEVLVLPRAAFAGDAGAAKDQARHDRNARRPASVIRTRVTSIGLPAVKVRSGVAVAKPAVTTLTI